MGSAVQLVGLYKAFNGNQVLNGVDLEIEEGELLTILGGTGVQTCALPIFRRAPPA